ncbi:MAG: hypothetical protein V3U16_05800 [Candidatus Neomarinimicrobiota bacterium]
MKKKKVQISPRIVALAPEDKAEWLACQKKKRSDVDWDAGMKDAEELAAKKLKDGTKGSSKKSATN